MPARTGVLPLIYCPTPYADRVESVCKGWAGTPYRHNGKHKGFGVDCLHFAAGVLDELYGVEHSKDLMSLPPDACVHNREGVEAAARALFKAYPVERVDGMMIQAGDLLVTSQDKEQLAPSHLRVASLKSTLWEATMPYVMRTGYGIFDIEEVVAIYRVKDKHLWLA